MNLHRYKVNFNFASSDNIEYEFLGTWIMFAGIFLFAVHLVAEENIRSVTQSTSFTIGLTYGLYWFCASSRVILGSFCILAFCISIYLLQLGTITLTNCEIEFTESYNSWTNRFKTPIKHFEVCEKKAVITLYYSAYIFSNFLVSYCYVHRLPEKSKINKK